MVQSLWIIGWQFLVKFYIHTPIHDPAIPPLGTYTRETKICGHIKICRQVFTGTLFIIINIWE